MLSLFYFYDQIFACHLTDVLVFDSKLVEGQYIIPSGIIQNQAILGLLAAGYTACYNVPYSAVTTSNNLTNSCKINNNDYLFVGGISAGSSTAVLGAFSLAGNVLNPTTISERSR
jgi:hypothetical protein